MMPEQKKLCALIAFCFIAINVIGLTEFVNADAYEISEADNSAKRIHERMKKIREKRTKKQNAVSNKLLYNDNLVKIYPYGYSLEGNDISKYKLKVVYNCSHEERWQKMDKRDFIMSTLLPLFPIKNAYVTPVLTAIYYKEGEKEYWDWETYRYDVKHADYTIKSTGLGPELCKRAKDAEKQAQKKVAAQEVIFFGECKGTFCNLPGGKYLNAIYRNDHDLIASLDKRYAGAFGRSFLICISNQYMYNYGKYRINDEDKCLTPQAISKTFSYTTPVTKYSNMYGMDMGSTGGVTTSATYTVNPEFYPLLSQVGDHKGGDWELFTAKGAHNRGMEITLKGAKKLQGTFKCNSREIKQFEKNLISLTTRYLENNK